MTESRWKRLYVRWARIGNWLLIPIYILVIALPIYYEWKAVIPPTENLQIAEGELIYKLSGGKRGTLIGLKTPDGARFFTCRKGLFGSRHDCWTRDFKRTNALEGKPAVVWWFKQSVYPFVTQDRLVRLVVDGKEVLSREITYNFTQRSRGEAPWYALTLFVFFVWIAVYFERGARRIKHGQSNS